MTVSPREFLTPVPLTGTQGERGTHWRYREDEDGVVWLILDKHGASANTFDREVFAELDGLLRRAEEAQPKAAVFRSAKPSGFAVGADLETFRGIGSAAEARREIADAHALIDRIAALPMVTIAAVHGHCVGGGLELALACDRIIARSDASLGFPEIRVGLHPGLGGTARLTRRISPPEAMKMMLTGKSLDARKALSLGLVDAVCEERHVANAVGQAVRGELDRRGGGASVSAMNLGVARPAIASRMETETRKRAPKAHYPAPYALIDLWREHGGSEREMLDAEIDSFANLLPTDTAQNLMRVFFLRENLKSLGKRAEARRIDHVHIVGGGTMGAEIGAWCAYQGKRVTIEDPDREALGRAVRSAAGLFESKLKGAARKAAFDRFMPDTRRSGLVRADLIIEAVPEKMELKQEVYEACEARMKDDALLATNTSSLPLDEL
ncbi:MAG: enoyl-CoA hydratase-related protein, partial [Alphaproteobacteria bacterium]